MKFLCDRCKTRYSIGDERVRGKILKIRCKNCGTIITVREGMTADPDAAQPVASEQPGRTKKATMVAPTALNEGINEGIEIANGAKGAPTTERLRPSPQQGSTAGRNDRGSAGASAPVGAKGPAGASAPVVGAREPAGVARDKAGAGAAALQAKRTGSSGDAGRGQEGMRRGAALEPKRGEPVNALNAAFASAMAKPPPALEEEWYVSIDGDQAGPFSLSEAQRWVAQKAEGAELHCWSEGFDDWLPVDKVGHFRGLRKRPAAAMAPPPLPRGIGAPPRAAPGAPVSVEEPKPLFAATMASLERGVPAAANPGFSLPSPAAPSARATPPLGTGIPARQSPGGRSPNGSRLLARDAGQGRAPGAIGADPTGEQGAEHGAKIVPVAPQKAQPGARSPAGKPASVPSVPARNSARGANGRPEDPFDTSEGGDAEPQDAETQIEAMPFGDSFIEQRRAVQSVLGPEPASGSDAALTTPQLPAAATLPGTGANAAVTSAAVMAATSDFGSDGDEELAIGEVSRVVKLGDIGRARNADRSGPVRRAKTASVAGGRQTGGSPILRSTGSLPSLSAGAAQDVAGAPAALAGDPGMTMAPLAKAHRRGLIVLMSVAGVMVLGVVAAVILLVTTDDETTGGSLGTVHDIDTSRPEDPITHRPIGPAGATNPAPNPLVPRPTPRVPGSAGSARPNPNPNLAGSNREPDPPQGNSLRGDEIEDVAHKHQEMTQRCYMRSQRGADAILIGDVKKIAVTLMIDLDGNVSDVQLSEHAADNLGKCLSGAIRSWKFRPSSGGTFRFSLNFVSG